MTSIITAGAIIDGLGNVARPSEYQATTGGNCIAALKSIILALRPTQRLETPVRNVVTSCLSIVLLRQKMLNLINGDTVDPDVVFMAVSNDVWNTLLEIPKPHIELTHLDLIWSYALTHHATRSTLIYQLQDVYKEIHLDQLGKVHESAYYLRIAIAAAIETVLIDLLMTQLGHSTPELKKGSEWAYTYLPSIDRRLVEQDIPYCILSARIATEEILTYLSNRNPVFNYSPRTIAA